jgi:predicted nucleotidyltransferase
VAFTFVAPRRDGPRKLKAVRLAATRDFVGGIEHQTLWLMALSGLRNSSMNERIQQARPELATICLRHNVRMLDLFGSAVVTDSGPATGDLELLVEFGSYPSGGYSALFRTRRRSNGFVQSPNTLARSAGGTQSISSQDHQSDTRIAFCRGRSSRFFRIGAGYSDRAQRVDIS